MARHYIDDNPGISLAAQKRFIRFMWRDCEAVEGGMAIYMGGAYVDGQVYEAFRIWPDPHGVLARTLAQVLDEQLSVED